MAKERGLSMSKNLLSHASSVIPIYKTGSQYFTRPSVSEDQLFDKNGMLNRYNEIVRELRNRENKVLNSIGYSSLQELNKAIGILNSSGIYIFFTSSILGYNEEQEIFSELQGEFYKRFGDLIAKKESLKQAVVRGYKASKGKMEDFQDLLQKAFKGTIDVVTTQQGSSVTMDKITVSHQGKEYEITIKNHTYVRNSSKHKIGDVDKPVITVKGLSGETSKTVKDTIKKNLYDELEKQKKIENKEKVKLINYSQFTPEEKQLFLLKIENIIRDNVHNSKLSNYMIEELNHIENYAIGNSVSNLKGALAEIATVAITKFLFPKGEVSPAGVSNFVKNGKELNVDTVLKLNGIEVGFQVKNIFPDSFNYSGNYDLGTFFSTGLATNSDLLSYFASLSYNLPNTAYRNADTDPNFSTFSTAYNIAKNKAQNNLENLLLNLLPEISRIYAIDFSENSRGITSYTENMNVFFMVKGQVVSAADILEQALDNASNRVKIDTSKSSISLGKDNEVWPDGEESVNLVDKANNNKITFSIDIKLV